MATVTARASHSAKEIGRWGLRSNGTKWRMKTAAKILS
jgi:hypothetical protein